MFQASQGFAMPNSKWFKSKKCSSLELKKHRSISKHEVVGSVRIVDPDSIKEIMSRIEAMGDDGAEMISFGPDASHTDLVFTCDSGTQTIDIFEGGFKTPSTGFNSASQHQSSLVSDIESLLAPELKGKIWKLPKAELSFGDFSITFHGNKDVDPNRTTTASLTNSVFTIRDKANKQQTIKILSGQRPPEPYQFKVNGKKMTLFTFHTKKGADLYPHHYQVVSRWF